MSRFRSFLTLSIALLGLALSFEPGFVAAQAQDETLEGLQVRWTELQILYAKKEAEIAAGGENAKQLQSEYRDMITLGNELIGKMKKMALASLKENSNDTNTLRLLMGILINDVSNGEEQSVLRTGDELIGSGISPLYFETAAKAQRLNIAGREIFEELAIRQREAKQDDLPRVQLETTKGTLVLELYEDQAPNTVINFVSLVESGHFSDIQFHRVIDGFMAQAGQNKGDGTAVPELGYTIACECLTPEARRHFSDCISMAHAGRDTGAGQFFLTFSRTYRLDGEHTCFGRVLQGAEVLEKIQRTASADETPIPNAEPDRILSAKVVRKRDHEYKPKKLGQKTEVESKANDEATESTDPAEKKTNDDKVKKEKEGTDPTDENSDQAEAPELELPGSSDEG